MLTIIEFGIEFGIEIGIEIGIEFGDEADMQRARTKLLVHPGEILHHEFLVPFDLSARALAAKIGVPANRLSEIVAGRRGVTADTAIRLGHYFTTSPEFWLNMQTTFDLVKAQAEHDYSKLKKARKAA